MAIRSRPPKQILTGAELDAVEQSQHPGLKELDHAALLALARRLRDHRAKARDIARDRRRTLRGKAEPRGAGATPDESGVLVKKQIFAHALKRVNARLDHLAGDMKRERTTELLRGALEARRAAKPHHPAPGRTAGKGMRKVENEVPEQTIDPRQIGSVSQQVRDNQARRDS